MIKTIKLYPKYKISHRGNVYSYAQGKRKKLIGNLSAQGYYQVSLGNSWGRSFKRINRLVAEAFIPNPHNYPIVLHLDNNPLNNHYLNLKWGTCEMNMQQMLLDGRGGFKLNPQLVIEIKALLKSKITQKVIAKQYGVSYMTIGKIKREEIWINIK